MYFFCDFFFLLGKRKHALFFGEMPETADPVIFALEQPAEDEMMPEMQLRGLLLLLFFMFFVLFSIFF